MRMYRIMLSLAMSTACSVAVLTPAFSEEYRGTAEQQMACTPDVWRLCFDQIPDVDRITACLRQNTPQLSGPCRSVFESNASVQQQTVRQPQERRRQAPPPAYDVHTLTEPPHPGIYGENQYIRPQDRPLSGHRPIRRLQVRRAAT